MKWSKFIRHFVKCNKLENRSKRDWLVYLCSFCHSISTRRELIEEHAIECDRNAQLTEEALPVATELLEPHTTEVVLTATRSSKRNHQATINSDASPEPVSHPAKRARTNDSTESKCKTEEAVLSDEEVGSEMQTEFVMVPFDEDAFCVANPHLSDEVRDGLLTKMRKLSEYHIAVVGRDSSTRLPQCPECNKVFSAGIGDLKRHFLLTHLAVEKPYLRECLKHTRVSQAGDKQQQQEQEQQLAMRNMRPHTLEPDLIRIPLPYSISGLRKLTEFLPTATQHYLAQKMRAYSAMSVNIHNYDNTRRFLCNQCSYSSPYALADVRKHIMGSHCGISTKHFRFCLQASRLDPNEFLLLSDDKILSFAKDVTKRAKQKSAVVSYEPKSRAQKYCWSSTKRRKNAAAYKSSKENKQAAAMAAVAAVTIKTEPCLKMGPHVVQTPHSHNQGPSLGGRKGVNALYLNSDISHTLALPFSETVLKTLLPAVLSADQIPSILSKMRLYASYSLKRLCKNERTVAFQCPCGRVFHTARIPDLKMRAATLADARRHVMGVHAKIPQSLITVCCQASRICRENEFQIYSDEMLLQLASERQGKFPDPPGLKGEFLDVLTLESKTASTVAAVVAAIVARSPIAASASSSLENAAPGPRAKNSFLSSSCFDEDNIATSVTVSPKLPPDIAAEDNTNILENDIIDDYDDDIIDDADVDDDDDEQQHQLGSTNGGAGEELSPPTSVTAASISAAEENATARLDSEPSKVERIIHLPYSLEALKCLTDGYCEPNFFPVLQDKMDIYARYKIFIVRKEGRRVFCCSGCPSSSPHGMGDVKKHILGVHARIPERFKAAAMHCSRLSREDTSLLPDHLLLQLAKMKWKGSVIKPLAELSMEDRLKTFSKKSWQLKPAKTTVASRSRSYSMVDGKHRKLQHGTITHRKSLKLEPLHLSSGAGDDLTEDNLTSNGASDIVIPDEFFVELVSQSAETGTGADETSYKCSLCSYESRFVGNSKGHIVREHLGIPPHSCHVCEQLFNSRASAEAHHEKQHAELAFSLAHYGPYKIAISKITVRDTTFSPDAIDEDIPDEEEEIPSTPELPNGASTNSFLQNDFDLCLI